LQSLPIGFRPAFHRERLGDGFDRRSGHWRCGDTGGVGNPLGALIGAAIIGVIENVIVLLGVSPYWQTIVSGAIVVLAISFDSIHRNFMKKAS